MNEMAKIHDRCLDYEMEILSAAENFGDRRNKAYKSGRKEKYKDIIPLLETIISNAEIYKEYLENDI